jgi:hypothetical protein
LLGSVAFVAIVLDRRVPIASLDPGGAMANEDAYWGRLRLQGRTQADARVAQLLQHVLSADVAMSQAAMDLQLPLIESEIVGFASACTVEAGFGESWFLEFRPRLAMRLAQLVVVERELERPIERRHAETLRQLGLAAMGVLYE